MNSRVQICKNVREIQGTKLEFVELQNVFLILLRGMNNLIGMIVKF